MLMKTQYRLISRLLITLLAGWLLLLACSQTPSPTTTLNPPATSIPLATAEPTAIPVSDEALELSLDTGRVATGFLGETVEAKSAGESTPYWEIMPEYTRVNLQDYPISDHLMQPQIFIYPVEALKKVNESAGDNVVLLQSQLQLREDISALPFLPLLNARQVIHAQTKYFDFKNGQGLRYLTWYSQGVVPVNNYELIYTYQGLTSDGNFYVAAVLPVNHPSLPADGTITSNEPPEFNSDYDTYLTNVVTNLDQQAASTFFPDITQLDAMMSSLEIK